MVDSISTRLGGLAYGGDYNPEQWPRQVHEEDVALMRAAGVNLVSLGVFAWARLEPAPGRYEFGWLDEVVDRLHANGIAVDLATPTAAPPPWFSRAHPHTLPVNREGVRVGVGGRQHACPSAPEYRAATAGIARALAEHYRDHPAVVLWHVHNEYGAPLGECYCEASVTAFRGWLRTTYQDLDALNDAWGTDFWGQRYGDWDEIDAPRANHTAVNPAQRLDFARFTSAEHLACFTLQRDILRKVTPAVPVTTNFMTTNCKSMDLWRWAPEVDVVANDQYLTAERPDNHIELAMSADLSRSLGGGAPWLLMEHSTGAVNWQPRNLAKLPGQLRRNSLAHVARGSDAVLFFQWRASRYGAEKFHSAMLPHAGTDSQVWRDVVELGAQLRRLAPVRGARVAAEVAVVWDWESFWALELDWRPSVELRFRERLDAYYAALWREHATVDFVHPGADLSAYRLVVAPSAYLLGEGAAKNLRGYVESGGHLLVSYFSGIVDEHDTVHPGAYPGALREVLGLSIEEFHPLREGEAVELSDGSRGAVWSERVRPAGAVPVVEFAAGPDAGHPAVTRHDLGRGAAWYVATAVDRLRPLLVDALDAAGVHRPRHLPDDLEYVRRGDVVFLINHGEQDLAVLDVGGVDLLDGSMWTGGVTVPAGSVRAVRRTEPTVH
ncbi:beta-galactosidase [Catellatospora sp. TT07R-123]|uniref:beta-galactosidase n=1 Tax=Catellatospora sp. TT07R-123 TaxID=2733863 RepID=UPI001B13BCA5|nr:beta-galactosidase [Catellatospora sp. TT07R-123]GHJ45158.1 beta-galactosidase [Catellatospora sp. TT07R-123]